MSINDKDERHLEDLLAMSRDQEPPVWLKGRITAQLDGRSPKKRRRLHSWLTRTYSLNFRPLQLAAFAAVLTLAFWGGMQIERLNTSGTTVQGHLPEPAAAITNAKANYLIGRGLLAGNRVQEALAYLQTAVELDPDNAEYSYWQGVGYWAAGQTDLERQSYIRSVREDPDYLPPLLYLGHNYLESGNYAAALESYQRVLQKDPDVPEAIYNSALAYQHLDQKEQEIRAFKEYLQNYRTGKWAYRAVEHLHALGDFSYRSYTIGKKRIILNMSDLLDTGNAEGKRTEISYLVQALSRVEGQELHIVAYNRQDRRKARETAIGLQRLVLDNLAPENDIKIRASWFDSAETVAKQNGNGDKISPSLLLFTRQDISDNRRKTT